MQTLARKTEPFFSFLEHLTPFEAQLSSLEVPEEEDPALPLVFAVTVWRAYQIFIKLDMREREIGQRGPRGLPDGALREGLAL